MRILVTGSVASGKTTFAKCLQELMPQFEYVNISDMVIKEKLFDKFDEKL